MSSMIALVAFSTNLEPRVSLVIAGTARSNPVPAMQTKAAALDVKSITPPPNKETPLASRLPPAPIHLATPEANQIPQPATTTGRAAPAVATVSTPPTTPRQLPMYEPPIPTTLDIKEARPMPAPATRKGTDRPTAKVRMPLP